MKKIFAFLIIISLLIIGINKNVNITSAEDSISTYNISHELYEFDSSNNYVLSDSNKVDKNIDDKSQIGQLTISSDITQQTEFRNDEAYGVSGNVSFSYSYDGSYQTDINTDWNLISHSYTSVDDQTLSGSIAKGTLIIQKSYNGDIWENASNPIMNYYEDNKSGSIDFYTSAGEDIFKGVYYRMIFAYELGRKTGESGVLWWKHDVYEYKRYAEVYTCYVVIDTPSKVSFHNLSVDDSDLTLEGYSIELLKKGETLNDGDTTIKGFSIDTFDANYLIGVSKNGGEIKYNYENGDEIIENGRYDITITSKLGRTSNKTIYVFNNLDDKGFSTYFGDYFINGERVYRDGNYPTFAKNSEFHINSIDENTPILIGQLSNLTIGEIIDLNENDRSEKNILLSAGTYTGEFYSGNPDNGSFYKYTLNFNIIDEESKPYVNYYNLTHSEKLCDLASKHYEVAYQTTKGGYIFVCFSMESYDSAFKYAYEIEKRFIEKAEDGYLYYKSIENSNKKVKYVDNIDLTQTLNYYAKQNVEINYFNPLDTFTYRTYNDDLLNCLEDLNITESIKVFPNSLEKEKLILRQPYINDFIFISFEDYDSAKVTAKCYKNNQTYEIKYDIPIRNQLTLTSKYLITETNKYGKSITYDVYFVNDNQTTSSWLISSNGIDETLTIDSNLCSLGTYSISADTVSLLSISNSIDSNTIVTIKAPDVYSYEIKCNIFELENIALYKKGKYILDFIDRVGNKYSVSITISGNTRYHDLFTSNSNKLCYTNIYNNSHLNQKGLGEEVLYDATELKKAIDRYVDKNLYTVSSYTNYYNCLQLALDVYRNASATQEEINNATENLNEAYKNLVLTTDKTELFNYLNKYENIDKKLYTSNSYANLTDAYNESMLIYLMDNPSEDEVTNAVNNLKKAFSLLTLRGIKEKLREKLISASKTDCSLYTPKSLVELNNAYSSSYKIYINEDAIQSEIDSAVKLLDDKIKKLIYRANFSDLLLQINRALSLEKDTYTKASWDKLVIEYNKALSVYKDFNNSQSSVNTAIFNLKQSIEALVEMADTTKLEKLIDEICKIDAYKYTSESVKSLKEKFDEAKETLASNCDQITIDKLEAELKQVKKSLIIREDKVELKSQLDYVLNSDKTITKVEIHNELVEAYNEALKVYCNLDVSQNLIQTYIEKLKRLIIKYWQ